MTSVAYSSYGFSRVEPATTSGTCCCSAHRTPSARGAGCDRGRERTTSATSTTFARNGHSCPSARALHGNAGRPSWWQSKPVCPARSSSSRANRLVCCSLSRTSTFNASLTVSSSPALLLDNESGDHAEHPLIGFGMREDVAVVRPHAEVRRTRVHQHRVPLARGDHERVDLVRIR